MKKAQQNEMWEELNHKAVKQEWKKMLAQSLTIILADQLMA